MAASFPSRISIFLLAGLTLAAASVTLADVLKHMQTERAATDFRASGRLVRVTGQQRTSYSISMRAKAFPGVVKLFCEVTDPAPARVRLLLESYDDGRTVIRTGHPGDHTPSELPAERWGEGLLDTDFAIEDLLENEFLWKNQNLIGEATFGARASIIVKSQPGAVHSTYSSVTTWLDKGILYPLKQEKVVKGSGAAKDYTFYGLRQTQGVWNASQIECKVTGRTGSTRLIINRGSEKAHLDEAAFNPSLLVK